MAIDDKVARVHLDLVEGFHFTATYPDLPHASPMAIDEAPPIGDGSGPNPAALLATAIGSCLAASLVFCLNKARASAQNVSADVSAHIVRNPAGRFRIDGVEVQLSLEINESERARLARCGGLYEDFCIVTESVREGIPVNVHLSTYVAESYVGK